MIAIDGGEKTSINQHVVDRLLPVASRVRLKAGASLDREDAVYFPLDGVAALMLARDDARFQIGFARGGDAIGLQNLFVPDFPVIVASVMRGGTFVRVGAEVLRRLIGEEATLRDRLSTYAMHAMGRYLSEAARALASSLEQRVARWILLCRRALDDDVLPVTHEGIAEALGVRRSGVTVALHVLEGQMLIRSKRARIEVLDRDGLRSFATAARHAPAKGRPMAMSAVARERQAAVELI